MQSFRHPPHPVWVSERTYSLRPSSTSEVSLSTFEMIRHYPYYFMGCLPWHSSPNGLQPTPIISEILWVCTTYSHPTHRFIHNKWYFRQRARGWLTNVTPSLRDLFSLSDPRHSSHAPSHRPSTLEFCLIEVCPLVEHTWHPYSVGD